MNAAAKPSAPSDCTVPRRSLLQRGVRAVAAIGIASLVGATALWAAAVGRFMAPNALAERSTRFRAGRVADYPPGKVETRYREAFGVWIVHAQYAGRWQICALAARCTHLGCITVWHEGDARFKCPCHGSGFSTLGINVEGPAPRPLERYAIRLLPGGQLEVDRARIFREELGQWTDPTSFVAT